MTATSAGQRWYATASSVELIVVKGGEGALSCAGAPMALERGDTAAVAGTGETVLLGKRYQDDTSGIVVLVTREGEGPLSVGGRELVAQTTQPLPSSD